MRDHWPGSPLATLATLELHSLDNVRNVPRQWGVDNLAKARRSFLPHWHGRLKTKIQARWTSGSMPPLRAGTRGAIRIYHIFLTGLG